MHSDNFSNNSDMYSYVLMMCMLPLATTFSQEIVKMIISMTKFIWIHIVNIYNKKFRKMNVLKIPMTRFMYKDYWSAGTIKLSEKGLYISKYLKKYHMSKLYSLSFLGQDGDIVPIKYDDYIAKEKTDIKEEDKTVKNYADSTKLYYSNSTDIYLEDDIFINFQSEISKDTRQIIDENFNVICFFKTQKDPSVLLKFMEKIEKDYVTDNNNNKEFLTKVFTLDTDKKGEVVYTEDIYDTSNSFDNLFFDEKENVLNELKILDCNEPGIKNKASLLLCGKSGSGKTAIVLAIARLLNRCIISIPPSKLNTSVLHQVIYSNKYNKHIIQNNQKIIFFDELDSVNKIMKKMNNINSDDIQKYDAMKKNGSSGGNGVNVLVNSNDKEGNPLPPNTAPQEVFDVGFLLSLLDGPYDQNGVVFCATANDVSMLDNGLYRNGRFTIFNMDYNDNKNIAKMIEHYYKVKLDEMTIESIRNDKALSNSLLKNMCIKAKITEKSIDELISMINKYNYIYTEQQKFTISVEEIVKKNDDESEDD